MSIRSKVLVVVSVHFLAMSAIGIACGIASLGVGFSGEPNLHFWWNLLFWMWNILDFPAGLLWLSHSVAANPWMGWGGQVLISLTWGFLLVKIWQLAFQTKEGNMKAFDQMTKFLAEKYVLVGEHYLSPKHHKTILGDATNRVCRFCFRKAPEVSFNKIAHTIPESLGNKTLFSAYECDSCNQLFGAGIENDFGHWSKPMRTFARIRGKKGVPTIVNSASTGWRVEYDDASGLQVSAYESNPMFSIDEIEKQITFELTRDSYTPIAVFKAFVKMGLSILPEAELPHFQKTVGWIKNTDHAANFVKESPILYTFVPGPMPNDKIALMVWRRKDAVDDVPYAFLILAYGNEVYQVFLPAPEKDRVINEQTVTLTPFPTPYDLSPSVYGKVMRGTLNLMGREQVKGQKVIIVCGFETMQSS